MDRPVTDGLWEMRLRRFDNVSPFRQHIGVLFTQCTCDSSRVILQDGLLI